MLDVFNDKIPLKTIKLKYNNRIPFLTNGLKNPLNKNIDYLKFIIRILPT